MDNVTYNYREMKIVAVLSENISVQVALNVIGHLSISIGAYAPNTMMGRPYLVDKSGTKHLGISKYPYIITRANPRKIRKAICEARTSEDVLFADFPKQMLVTGHDDELDLAIKDSAEEDIEYFGAVFYGPSDAVSKITGKFSLWK